MEIYGGLAKSAAGEVLGLLEPMPGTWCRQSARYGLKQKEIERGKNGACGFGNSAPGIGFAV